MIAPVDNPVFDSPNSSSDGGVLHIRETPETNGRLEIAEHTSHKNCIVDFFNPIVAIHCINVIIRKRENHGRAAVIMLIFLYFIAIGPAFGEEPNEYNFTRIKLNWDGLAYSPFATYGNAISLIGTMVMVGGLSKLFKLSDPLVGFLGTFCSCISRIVYALATTGTMLYVARTIDMFISVRALTIKSVLSTFVDPEELGRIFSIIGIIEAFGKFVFVSIYSIIYEETLETWPSAFYMCSFVCLLVTAFLFVVLYFVVERKHKFDALQKAQQAKAAEAMENYNGETTHM